MGSIIAAFRVGDKVEVCGRDVNFEPICDTWTRAHIVARGLLVVSVKINGLSVPRTLRPVEGVNIRRVPREIVNLTEVRGELKTEAHDIEHPQQEAEGV